MKKIAPTRSVKKGCLTVDNEELIDLIAEAIDDSLDMDWVSTDGAKSVLRALEREGYEIVERAKSD